MIRSRTLWLAVSFFLFALAASAQPCPKVTYTTPAATIRKLVDSVNCLASSADKAKPSHTENIKSGFVVESFPVIGPQHTHSYRKIVLAMLSVPAGSEIKTALVTPDSPEASVAATAGAECKVKINPDNTVSGQCSLTGGTFYVVYYN